MAFIEKLYSSSEIAGSYEIPEKTVITAMQSGELKHILNVQDNTYYTYPYYVKNYIDRRLGMMQMTQNKQPGRIYQMYPDNPRMEVM